MPEQLYKFPKTPGGCVDRLYDLEQQRAAAQLKVDEIKKEYTALEEYLLASLPKGELEGALGRKAMVKITRSTVPNATDWPKTYADIKKNDAWDLLQKRLSAPACRARWEDKKTIPACGTVLEDRPQRHETIVRHAYVVFDNDAPQVKKLDGLYSGFEQAC